MKKDRTQKFPAGATLYKMLIKAILRSWPDENGCMLLTDKQPPTDFFTSSALLELLTAETSECVARPGLGVSMAAASLESCSAALAVLPTSSDKKFGQTGIPAVKKLLESLSNAVAVANVANAACSDASSSKSHIEKMMKALGKKDCLKQRLKDFARLADTASRIYAGATAGMELAVLAANPKAWAKKIPEEKQDKAICKFVRKKTLESLGEAVAVTNAARLEAKAPRKKRTFGDSSAAAPSQEDSSSESDKNSDGKESGSGSDEKSRSSSSDRSARTRHPKKPKKPRKPKSAKAKPRERAGPERPAAVELSLDDEEDEAADVSPDLHLLSWEESEVAKFIAECETMIANQDSKKDRLPLSALVALLDNVPEAVLAENGLAKPLQTLKQMTRLPKKEKLIGILDSTQRMAAKAKSAHEQARVDAGLPAADDLGEGGPADAAEVVQDDRE